MLDPRYGNDWTEMKLSVLEDRLNAYITALKNQSFKLIYIDAFARSGIAKQTDMSRRER